MIEIQPTRMDDAEGTWSLSCDETGKMTLSKRTVGSLEDLAGIAQQLAGRVGLEVQISAPFTGLWVCAGGELAPDTNISWILTERYVRENSSGGGGGGDTTPESEEGNFQNIEKPLTSAPFWKKVDSSEGTGSGGTAMKIVQAYIDAEDPAEAAAKIDEWIQQSGAALKKDVILKMAEKRLAGVSGYYYPAPTLSRTSRSTMPPTSFGADCGRITKPDMRHIPVPEGFQWLGGGDVVRWEGGVYTRTQTWIGADSWDQDLYGGNASGGSGS